MYSLITLYCGYFIYLIVFFRQKKFIKKNSKKNIFLYKEVTIILGIKLILLTLIYYYFFSNKIPKKVIYENLNQQILF
jgi:hypothetical protein